MGVDQPAPQDYRMDGRARERYAPKMVPLVNAYSDKSCVTADKIFTNSTCMAVFLLPLDDIVGYD
jgi:hypothetical protein